MPNTILGNVAMVPKGTWSAGTYNKNQYVYHTPTNATYVALKDGITIEPMANGDGVNWQVLCEGIGVVTDNNFTNADKTKVTALPSTTPGEVDGLALYNTLKTFTDSKGIAGGLALYDTLAIFMAQKGTASGVASTNADNQVIQDALNALSLGGILASLYPTISNGTWIPEIYGYGVAGTPTYSIQTGAYRKHGKLCHIFAHITLTGKGGMTSYLTIGGLPFAAALPNALSVSNVVGVTGLTDTIQPYVYGDGNIIPLQTISSTGVTPVTADNILDTFEIYMAGTYETI